MAEFEELRLTVNLVDNASTGLVKIRTELDSLTKSAGQMTKSFSDAVDSATQLGQAAVTVTPKLAAINVEMRALQRHALDTGRAFGTMGFAVQQGVGGLPRLAMGLWDATAGLKGLGDSIAKVAPAARTATLAIGGTAIAIGALTLVTVAYGISVLRFAKEMDQLGRTARVLGMSFAELKNAQDQAKAFGHTTESVVRSFQGIQAAQLDLYKNNSELRQRLLAQGVDANWINQLAVADPMRARTMIAQYGKALERQALDAGVGKSVAAAIRNQFYAEYGQKPEDMELALKPVSPERAAEMARIEEQSRRVTAIWGEISLKMSGLTFGALSAGLPVLLGSLRIADGLFSAIGASVLAIDEGLGLLGINLITVLKGIPLLGLGVALIEGLYKLGGGGQDPTATPKAVPQSGGGYTSPQGGSAHPLFQRIAFSSEELTEETGENTVQTEKLTSQLEKLNAFFERMEAEQAAAKAAAGAGSDGSGVQRASLGPGGGGSPSGGGTPAPPSGGATPPSSGSTTQTPAPSAAPSGATTPSRSGATPDKRSAREAELSLGGDKRSAREAELSLGGGSTAPSAAPRKAAGPSGGANQMLSGLLSKTPFGGMLQGLMGGGGLQGLMGGGGLQGLMGGAMQGAMRGGGGLGAMLSKLQGGGGLPGMMGGGGINQMLSGILGKTPLGGMLPGLMRGGGLPGMLSGLLGRTPFGGMLQGLIGHALRGVGAGSRVRGGGGRGRGRGGPRDRRSAREAELTVVGGDNTVPTADSFQLPSIEGSFPTLDSVPSGGKGSILAGLQANPPGGGLPAYDRPDSDPSGDYPGGPLDRPALDRSALSEAMKIRAGGSVDVNVGQGPTKAAAAKDDLFTPTALQKSEAAQMTQHGPSVAATVAQYMGR